MIRPQRKSLAQKSVWLSPYTATGKGMLYFQLNVHSGVPVYRQLMDQIRHYVAAGALPSIRELAKSLAVNPTTIVKAYGELAHEGVILIQHGRGAFVAASLPPWPRSRWPGPGCRSRSHWFRWRW